MKFARRSLGTATSKPGRGLTPGHPIRPGTFTGCCDPGPDLEAGTRTAKDRGNSFDSLEGGPVRLARTPAAYVQRPLTGHRMNAATVAVAYRQRKRGVQPAARTPFAQGNCASWGGGIRKDPWKTLRGHKPVHPGTYLPTVLFTETANLAWLPVGEGAL